MARRLTSVRYELKSGNHSSELARQNPWRNSVGVSPAVGKTPRQTAPFPQPSSVVAHFSDTRAMLPLASRARPTARPVRATYWFAGHQTLLSGDTSVASCGNFPNHRSWHATPHFLRGELCHQAAE